jgi:hypothetical protein
MRAAEPRFDAPDARKASPRKRGTMLAIGSAMLRADGAQLPRPLRPAAALADTGRARWRWPIGVIFRRPGGCSHAAARCPRARALLMGRAGCAGVQGAGGDNDCISSSYSQHGEWGCAGTLLRRSGAGGNLSLDYAPTLAGGSTSRIGCRGPEDAGQV